jgi:acetolactate synthase I/II/III large subunit
LDIDPGEVGRIFRTDVGLVGDAKLGLKGLVDVVNNRETIDNRDKDWLVNMRALRTQWEEKKSDLFSSDDKPIKPYRVMAELNEVLDAEDILVCDAGFASGWGAIYYSQEIAGRHSLYPRGLAGLGYAVAAGVGAQLAAPDHRVVTLAGDGGVTYSIAELSTQAHLNLPIVNVVLNNAAFGWVKWAEQAWYSGSFSASDLQPINFAKVAEGLGCVGITVEEPTELKPALIRALDLNKPVLVEVIIDAESTPNVKS